MRSDALCALALALTACGACPEGDLSPLSRTPAFAVILTPVSYDATVVALLDADGALITEDWIDSGSRPAGLAAALSSDVVLPTTPFGDGTLTLIDRYDTDVLDRVALPSGTPVTQISVKGGETIGWSPNPLDVLALDATHVVVSRNDPNPTAATALDRGDDLAVIDLASQTVTGAVDLSFYDTTMGATAVYARPDQLARVGASIVVGLDRLSADHMTSATGTVVVLDASLAPSGLSLAPLTNCGQVRAVPGGSEVAIVCAGAPFATEAGRASTAGVGRIRVDATGNAVLNTWRASDHVGAPAPSDLVAVLDATHAVVQARGASGEGTTDRLLLWDLPGNTLTLVYTGTEHFGGTSGAFDAVHGRLYVPEGARGVHVFAWDGATLADMGDVDVSPCRKLDARQVAAL